MTPTIAPFPALKAEPVAPPAASRTNGGAGAHASTPRVDAKAAPEAQEPREFASALRERTEAAERKPQPRRETTPEPDSDPEDSPAETDAQRREGAAEESGEKPVDSAPSDEGAEVASHVVETAPFTIATAQGAARPDIGTAATKPIPVEAEARNGARPDPGEEAPVRSAERAASDERSAERARDAAARSDVPVRPQDADGETPDTGEGSAPRREPGRVGDAEGREDENAREPERRTGREAPAETGAVRTESGASTDAATRGEGAGRVTVDVGTRAGDGDGKQRERDRERGARPESAAVGTGSRSGRAEGASSTPVIDAAEARAVRTGAAADAHASAKAGVNASAPESAAAQVNVDAASAPKIGEASASVKLAPAPVAEGQPSVEAQVSRGIGAALSQRGGSITLKLAPSNLGHVKVSLKLDQGSVTLDLEATTERAHRALTKELGALKASLESRGMRVDRAQVHLAPAPAPHAGQTDAGQRSDAQQQERDGAHGERREAAQEEQRRHRGEHRGDRGRDQRSFQQHAASWGPEGFTLGLSAQA